MVQRYVEYFEPPNFSRTFSKTFSSRLFEPTPVLPFAAFVSRLRRTVFVIADAKVGIISKRASICRLFLSFFLKNLHYAPIYLIIYKTAFPILGLRCIAGIWRVPAQPSVKSCPRARPHGDAKRSHLRTGSKIIFDRIWNIRISLGQLRNVAFARAKYYLCRNLS